MPGSCQLLLQTRPRSVHPALGPRRLTCMACGISVDLPKVTMDQLCPSRKEMVLKRLSHSFSTWLSLSPGSDSCPLYLPL